MARTYRHVPHWTKGREAVGGGDLATIARRKPFGSSVLADDFEELTGKGKADYLRREHRRERRQIKQSVQN